MDESILQQFGFKKPHSEDHTMRKLGLQCVANTYYGIGNYGYIGKKYFSSECVPKYFFIGFDTPCEHSHLDMVAEHYTHIETLGHTIEELIKYFQSDPENFFKPYPLKHKDFILSKEAVSFDAKRFRSFREDPSNAKKCFLCSENQYVSEINQTNSPKQ